MNQTRDTYKDTEEKGREKTVQKLFEIRAIQLLLAGVYFLFGIKLTKADKALQRERAIIMRKSISAANLDIKTQKNNTEAFKRFANDHGPGWLVRINSLSIVIPDKRSADPGSRQSVMRCIELLLAPKLQNSTSALFGRDTGSSGFALVRYDIGVRAPP